MGGRCRERAASEGGRGNAGARAVGIDDDLLAFVAQRYGLYAGAGEEPQRLADVEQRGVFDAQSSRSPADERHQGEYVGRTILEPYQFASVARTAVGVGIDPVEMQSGLCEVCFGGGVDDLDVRGAEPPEVLRGDAGERLVAFERHHAAETTRQEKGVGAQPAGEIEDGPARDPLVAAQASLDACSNASGGRMHCAAAYEGSFASARARYLTCVATSRAWGVLRSKATSSGSRPRLAAMARCTSSVSSSVYSPGVIMPANVRFFSARKTMQPGW